MMLLTPMPHSAPVTGSRQGDDRLGGDAHRRAPQRGMRGDDLLVQGPHECGAPRVQRSRRAAR